MGRNREKSEIAIAILEKYKFCSVSKITFYFGAPIIFSLTVATKLFLERKMKWYEIRFDAWGKKKCIILNAIKKFTINLI